MLIYKHFSFDLWMTLIRSDPWFKRERAAYFHARYNGKNKHPDEITHVFRQVDLMCNAINERTGKNIDADEMYLMVISMLNDGDIDLNDVDVSGLYGDMDQLFFTHMPQVYSPDTPGVLATVKATGATANILSNTGFIKGRSLRVILKELGLSCYFDFQLYSDEAGMSKPAPGFFSLMTGEILARRSGLTLNDIIHIGDNPNADVKGAEQAGIAGRLINSNNVAITKLISHVTAHILPA